MSVTNVARFDWLPVRDAVKDVLESVESVALVQPYVRFDVRERTDGHTGRFKSRFLIPKGESRINVWAIHRNSQSRAFLTSGEYLVIVNFSCHFWYELNDEDATQDTFDQIVDDVIEAFQEPLRLDNTVELQGPVQLTVSDHRYFAGELVHHAELQIPAQHRVRIDC